MVDGPDPLGKRALYWMPVEVEAEVESDDGGGARADPATAAGAHHAPSGAHHVPEGVRHPRPAGKHALFSDATPAAEPERDLATATGDDPVPRIGLLSVACSRCGSVTRVGLVEFLILQLPVGVWLPMRVFDRWMTCPACRRRTWTSVTLTR
ncbi:MAG: hypothetical protein ABSF84_17595 [Acidimicrobiales bacterium]|jgi:hypothetical protein